MVESLQEEIKTLQSQITAECNTTQWLHAALSDVLDREKLLQSELEEEGQESPDQTDLNSVPDSVPKFTSLAQLAEKQGLRPLYLTKELEIDQEIFYFENEEVVMRPVIKTENTNNGQGGRALQITIWTVPYSVAKMSKIQENTPGYLKKLRRSMYGEYHWPVATEFCCQKTRPRDTGDQEFS